MGQDILKCAKLRLLTFKNMNVNHVLESDAPERLVTMANRFDTCPHRLVLPLIGDSGPHQWPFVPEARGNLLWHPSTHHLSTFEQISRVRHAQSLCPEGARHRKLN